MIDPRQTACRRNRRPSPPPRPSSSAAGRSAAPRTGSPTRRRSSWPGRSTSSPPTARPRSAWPGLLGCSPGRSARARRRHRRRDRAARGRRDRSRRGSGRGRGARGLARRQRAPVARPTRGRRAAPDLVHRRRPAHVDDPSIETRPLASLGPRPPPRAAESPHGDDVRRHRPPLRDAADPDRRRRRARLRVRRGRATPPGSPSACRRRWPAMPAVALALVTSQLAAERELATLRARDAERTTFVSTVAHELRTPLTGLRGYLELILGGQVARPGRRARLPRAEPRRSSTRWPSSSATCSSCRGSSRARSNLEIGPFSIAEAGGQVASSLLPIAIDRGIRLTTTLPPRLRVATGDRRRVEQILTNLVGERPEVHAGRAAPSRSTGRFDGPRRDPRRPRRRRRASRPTTAAGSSSGSSGWPATSGSPARASACRSPATSPGRWAATSTSRPCPAPARRSSSSCPGPADGRARARSTRRLGAGARDRGGRARGADRPAGDRRRAADRDERRRIPTGRAATAPAAAGGSAGSARCPVRSERRTACRPPAVAAPRAGFPQVRRATVDSWITALTSGGPALTSGIRTDRLGNEAGEGHGETRPRTGPAAEDRDPSAV